MEGITHTQQLRAKEMALKRQKRFNRQIKVLVASNTWIYVPKEIARSKKKLQTYLEKRQERLRQKNELEEQLKRDRIKRSKTSYHTNKSQRKAQVRKIMGSG